MALKDSKSLASLSIPDKANRILNFILVAFLLITIRVWHLSVIQHDARLEEARHPQRRVVIERPLRATIRDRYNIPLAINKVQYNASVCYAHIKEVPYVIWDKLPNGKKVKKYARKEHIKALSELLAQEFNLNANRVEDLIWSKASQLNSTAFVLKENINEEQYYKLKMLQRQWPGVVAERTAKRYYPLHTVASDIIGYMGAMSRSQYDAIVYELQSLNHYIKAYEEGQDPPLPTGLTSPRMVFARLKELQERSYSLNDYVGRSGVEGMFDEQLRGFRGKKTYLADMRGHFLRELPGSIDAQSGQRFLLTISAELQDYAEQLLAVSEQLRQDRSFAKDRDTKQQTAIKQPWIKGGTIVVMDPNDGQVLALASHPRFDPNDFVPGQMAQSATERQEKIQRWLESPTHIAAIWDGKQDLQRELFDLKTASYQTETQKLTWPNYLYWILPNEHPVKERLSQLNKLKDIVPILQSLDFMIQEIGIEKIHLFLQQSQNKLNLPASCQKGSRLLSAALAPLQSSYDRYLFLDLLRLIVDPTSFDSSLLNAVGSFDLNTMKAASCDYACVLDSLKLKNQEIFRHTVFAKWREGNEKSFLKEKRKGESLLKQYPKPYLDYLDKQEDLLFSAFWQAHKWDLLASFFQVHISLPANEDFQIVQRLQLQWQKESFKNNENPRLLNAFAHLSLLLQAIPTDLKIAFLKTLRLYEDLQTPLLGYYAALKAEKGVQLQSQLAGAFYPRNGWNYTRSYSYRQTYAQGSIFKIVTAYAALVEQYTQNNQKISPDFLTIIDDAHHIPGKTSWNVGFTTDHKPIPQLYKGGRLPRSSHSHIGRVDLISAFETSSNPYFSLLAAERLQSPQQLTDTAQLFCYGEKTGIDLPGEAKGYVPTDLSTNRTGLYAMAIGQHSMSVTPLQTAVMLSTLANGGQVLKPQIISLSARMERKGDQDRLFQQEDFPYGDLLSLGGIDFPIFSASIRPKSHGQITSFSKTIKRHIFMPENIRKMILKGLKEVIISPRGSARASLIRSYQDYPEALKSYKALSGEIVGKSGTAERVERIDISEVHGLQMVNHLWFGLISFDSPTENDFAKPELVVVVFLRHGDYGKEAAPIAAQIVRRYRQIKENASRLKLHPKADSHSNSI